MNRQTISSIALTSVFLVVFGLGGLLLVIIYTSPFLGPRWLLYFFLVAGLAGMALPAVTYLNFRFPSEPVPDGGILIRQALWVGILGGLLIWLQTGRFLNPVLTIFLIFGFLLIEMLIRWAERSHWPPNRKIQ